MNSKNTSQTSSACLAIDTSGRTGSVAAGIGKQVLGQIELQGTMRHSIELFPSIEQLLKQVKISKEKIDSLFFTSGPGSFTGIRIAVTVAKMLAFARNIRLVAVNTLDAIAQNAYQYAQETQNAAGTIASVLDAKRNLFFIATYEKKADYYEKIDTDLMITAENYISQHTNTTNNPIVIFGEGLKYYQNKFTTQKTVISPDKFWTIKAENVYNLGYNLAQKGNFVNPNFLTPYYIRRPEAEVNWEKRHS